MAAAIQGLINSPLIYIVNVPVTQRRPVDLMLPSGMMHKCIMVKVGGSQQTKENENRKKFINFAEIRRNMQYASFVQGDGRLCCKVGVGRN